MDALLDPPLVSSRPAPWFPHTVALMKRRARSLGAGGSSEGPNELWGGNGFVGRDEFLAAARQLLSITPPSVVTKTRTPPTGDKHDYFSLSIYFWPDPESPDGLPYVPRDGEINPEVADYDRQSLVLMADLADNLTLAYLVSGDPVYAERAAAVLRAWFVTPSTRMNPNMLYAQHIPGENPPTIWPAYPPRYVPGREERGVWVSFGGVIEAHLLINVIDVVEILRMAPFWTDHDDRETRRWFAEFGRWLLTHPHGADEASCRNNHAIWYWAQVAAYSAFADGELVPVDSLKDRFRDRLQQQIKPDGSQPEELVRADALSYSFFSLNAFVALACRLESEWPDVWTYTAPSGASLETALTWTLRYATGEEPWPWKQARPLREASVIEAAVAGWLRYGTPKLAAACRSVVSESSLPVLRFVYEQVIRSAEAAGTRPPPSH